MTSPEICPVCGADVPTAARACPECGADDTTGWNEAEAVYDGLDLPDDEFHYTDYCAREFGAAGKPAIKRWLWPCMIGLIFVLLALILVVL